jgi:hypothetical protein
LSELASVDQIWRGRHAARARAGLAERPDVLLFPIHLRSPTEQSQAVRRPVDTENWAKVQGGIFCSKIYHCYNIKNKIYHCYLFSLNAELDRLLKKRQTLSRTNYFKEKISFSAQKNFVLSFFCPFSFELAYLALKNFV